MSHPCEWHPDVECPGVVVALVECGASARKQPDGSWRSARYLCAAHKARVPRARVVATFDEPTTTPEPEPVVNSPVDVSWIHEYGLSQKLSNSIRVF